MTGPRMNRRRFLTVSACAGALSALPSTLLAGRAYRWQGSAMGGWAEVLLHDSDRAAAARVSALCMAEVARLEREFSLFNPSSALNTLNRTGHLDAPSLDMRRVLATAARVRSLTDGAFDITVQPLWEGRRENWQSADVVVDGGAVRLTRPGAAITLNGIAQGYITDRVTALLRGEGFHNVLVNVGEVRALGPRADGTPWRVDIGGARPLDLADGAVATSRQDSRRAHLFNPRTGEAVAPGRSVSVTAPTAMLADALSTGIAAMESRTALAFSLHGVDIHLHTETPKEES